MGRKRKVDLNLDEQMQDVRNEITKMEETLKKLRQQEKELEKKRTDQEKELLYQAVKDSGKSVDEILRALGK